MYKLLNLITISLFLLLTISGCQTVPKYQSPSPEIQALWEKHHAQLHHVKTWQLSGRIAILMPEEHLTLNVHWDQMEEAYILRFNIPPGQGAFFIQGDDNNVVMHTSDGEIYTARDPNALVAKILKVEVPVTYLHAWIRGMPVPDIDVDEHRLDFEGNLSYLKQADWIIDYKSYTDTNAIKLPRKLFLQNKDIEVRIVISHWNVEDSLFADQ